MIIVSTWNCNPNNAGNSNLKKAVYLSGFNDLQMDQDPSFGDPNENINGVNQWSKTRVFEMEMQCRCSRTSQQVNPTRSFFV